MYVVALYTDIVSGILSPQSKIPSYDVFCKEVCWELSSVRSKLSYKQVWTNTLCICWLNVTETLLHVFSNLKSFPFEDNFLLSEEKKVGCFKARQLCLVVNVHLTRMKFAQLCLSAPAACTCRRDCVEQTCRFSSFPDLYEESDGLICLNVQMIDHQF